MGSGMDDYLAKPVRQSELYQVIQGVTGKAALGDPSSPADPNAAESELDEEQLAYQRETLGHVFSTLVETYLAQTPGLLAELDEAVSEEDAEQLWGLAHRLKSSSAQVGALQFSELAKVLEQAGRAGRVDVHDKIQQMHQVYAQLEPKLKVLTQTTQNLV